MQLKLPENYNNMAELYPETSRLSIQGQGGSCFVQKKDYHVSLTWKNVNYTIEDGTVLLNDLSGIANAGEVLGIMGTSGSGKTTLLNQLAGKSAYSRSHTVTGEIKTNGTDIKSFDYKHFSNLVLQDDILLPH